MMETGRPTPRGKETRGADPRDIFVPAAFDLDARALFEGRGETIEPGLSIIDAEVPIAGAGEVDLVAIDATRRLVVIDLAPAGAGASADEARALAHAEWFRDNLPVVRRMYQLWNVRWEAPIRVVWISGSASASRGAPQGGGEDAGFVFERLVAVSMRTRDGREAVFLAAPSAAVPAEATAPSVPAAPVSPRAARPAAPVAPAPAPARFAPVPPRPRPSALAEIEVTSAPAAPRARGGQTSRPEAGRVGHESFRGDGIRSGENDHEEEFRDAGAHFDGAPLRGEAYRRELGLTQEEFAEFFVGPKTAARPAQGGGVR